MIHYELRCSADHGFDGWFRDSGAFDQQVSAGLLECPVCGGRSVHRALMAPSVSRRRDVAAAPPAKTSPSAPAANESPVAVGGERMPDQVRAALLRIRAEIERRCEYVGPEFANEARRIHHGEGDKRGIYGEATPAEAEALADEGIEVGRIPWLPRAES